MSNTRPQPTGPQIVCQTECDDASLLRRGKAFDDLPIEYLLFQVEDNLRNMSFVMHLVHAYGGGNDGCDMHSMFETFYQYVDDQMDTLTRLRVPLQREIRTFSLNDIRSSADFRRNLPPREAFTREQDYEAFVQATAKSGVRSASQEKRNKSQDPAQRSAGG